MIWVTKAKHIDQFELEIGFSDGKVFQVDLSGSLSGEVFEPLRVVDEFKKFRVDSELDTVVWENGADFAPEFLYELGVKQARKANQGVG